MAVTTAGRPVGIAETENAIAVRNRTSNGVFRARPMPIEAASATPAMTRIWLVSALSCRVSGVTSSFVTCSMPLMWPTSVAIPVLTTRIVPAPRVDLGVHERQVDAIPEGGIRRDGLDLLGDREALAGQRRLVDLERRRGEDPPVGRDEVAGLDVDDVARDEVLHRQLDERTVAPDLRLDDHHLLEGGHAGGGLALLAEAHGGVEQRQRDEDDAGRAPGSG